MAKRTRQTPRKRPYKAPFKTYTINSHSVAYRVYKGRLLFYPIYENGSIDYCNGALVEESPDSFRSGHKIAMLQLGITNKVRQQKIVAQIRYY